MMAAKPTGTSMPTSWPMMVPHHQGAIDMAVAVLRSARNAQIRRLAQEIIVPARGDCPRCGWRWTTVADIQVLANQVLPRCRSIQNPAIHRRSGSRDMSRSSTLTVLLARRPRWLVGNTPRGPSAGRCLRPDIPISHRDRVYSAEQSRTRSLSPIPSTTNCSA